jgi:hypothetical protein
MHCVVLCWLQAPLVSTGADPAVVVASLRRNMEALNQLSNDRAGAMLLLLLLLLAYVLQT